MAPQLPPKLVEGRYTMKSLVDTAERVVTKKTTGSRILDLDAENQIPKFGFSEISLGKVLGRGGFCVVHEIAKISLLHEKNSTDDPQLLPKLFADDEHAIHNIVQNRPFMEAHCLRGKGKDCRYALKRLQESCLENAQTYINGVVDLAIEARFLSVVRHPNIIKMRAMALTSPFSLDEPFFVILDRLYDIMGTRIAKWKKQKPSGIKKMMDRGGKMEIAFWLERITVAYDLACALAYLHESKDLKPDNIGFDVRGDVKIFDFGLAREFDRAQQDDSGCYKMTGDTGSPRYMAPEIALNTSYNENVDVYSFCILFWQILRLETPFEGCTMSTFHKRVVVDGLRPTCDPKWPRAISSMIESGWADYSQRPPMADVAVTIRDEISAHSDQSQLDMLDISRKSDASFRAANESKDNPSTGLVRGEHGKSLASFRKLNLNEK